MWSAPGETAHSQEKFSTQGGKGVMTHLHVPSFHLPPHVWGRRRFPFLSPAKQPAAKSPPLTEHQTSCSITLAPHWDLNRQ